MIKSNFDQIKNAIQKRDQFLREHPELIPLQDEINRQLAHIGPDARKRSLHLQQLLLESWQRITCI